MRQMNIIKMGSSIARRRAPIFMIAILAVQFFPAEVAAAQLKLHTDQQIEVDKLHYKVAFRGKTVDFEIPDLST